MTSATAGRAGTLVWRCRDRVFDLSQRAHVLGVVNVTPDSFSDGGRSLEPADAIEHAHRLLAEGADLVDLGAESTRPGAQPVPAAEQLRRLEPVLEALRDAAVAVSVDTASAAVASRALELGACVINDVTALADPGMAAPIARAGAGVVLMHMRGTPATMQQDPEYADVVAEVARFLRARREAAVHTGIAAESVVLDPGIGFGKTPRHNFELLAGTPALAALGAPLLVGVSRKSFLAGPDRDPPADRAPAGAAAAAIAVFLGARLVRTHDVAATRRALAVADAMRAVL